MMGGKHAGGVSALSSRIAALLLAVLALAGCVQTQVDGFVDPAFRGGTARLASIVVEASADTIAERVAIETSAAAALAELGIRSARMVDVAPPTRPNPGVAVLAPWQGVLRIWTTGQRVDETWVPPSFSPPETRTVTRIDDDKTVVTTETTPGFTEPGRVVRTPVATYRSELRQLSNGAVVWIGDASAQGEDFRTLGDEIGRAIVARMREQGAI
jgi:hypothetical protein